MSTQNSCLLIGSGRLARHLRHWCRLNKSFEQLLCWDRSQSVENLKKCLDKRPLVWLAISDSAISSFYDEHLKNLGLKVVHFSGALDDKRMISAHPLMSFSSEIFNHEIYAKIHFTLSGVENLSEALPGFNNSFSMISGEHKALYHALCVLTGNFPQLIWSEALQNFRRLNIPDSAVETYIQQISTNFISLKEKAVTGPLARRDLNTIEKNLQALSDQKTLQRIYETFVKEFVK